MASHLGGTRNPMVVAWPEQDQGERRPALAVHALHRHRPDDPRSGRHPGAEGRRRDRAGADGRHELPLHVRRRERRGAAHRAVLRGDRLAGDLQGRLVGRAPASTRRRGTFSPATLAPFAPGKWDPEQDTWELYYLPDDFTQAKDLAAENPEKLAELKELFWQEAERNRVLPLLGSHLRLLRHPAAAADGHPLHVRGRRPEHPEGARAPRSPGARTRSRRSSRSPRAAPRA